MKVRKRNQSDGIRNTIPMAVLTNRAISVASGLAALVTVTSGGIR